MITTTPGTQQRVQRVVVTGGARGIGGEIATRLSADGMSVAIIDVLADGAAHAASIGADFIQADLSDADAALGAVDEAIGSLGGADALVNCAGILRLGPLLDTDVDTFDRIMAINTRATFLAMQQAARTMIAAGTGGRIVNLASMAAKKGGGNEAAYAASKAAVVALTRAAALEWGAHGITVNAVCPGFVLTEMGAATRTPELVASWEALSPLGRLGTPADVAGMVAFLLSPDASYLTGQALNVTGGMVMH